MNNESVGPSGAPSAHSTDVAGVLKAAREKIARGWVQGDSFRMDEHGKEIAWCLSGAIRHQPDRDEWCAGCIAFSLLSRAIDAPVPVTRWNDTPGRTQAEVLAVVDRAIALSEGHAPEAPYGK